MDIANSQNKSARPLTSRKPQPETKQKTKGTVMRKNLMARITAITLFAALTAPVRLSAQDNRQHNHHNPYHHHYAVIDMGTFGGPNSGYSDPFPLEDGLLNNRGAVVGFAETTAPDPFAPNCMIDCYLAHAFRSEDGDRK